MTQIDSWSMTGNVASFRLGATAFRNARDLAKQHRDRFIQDANARASGVAPAPAGLVESVESGPLPDISGECIENRDKQEDTNGCGNDSPVVAGEVIDLACSPLDGDSQDPEQVPLGLNIDKPSTSLISSSPSVLSGDASSTKRPKHSLSPHSKSVESRRSKSRTRPSTGNGNAELERMGSSETHAKERGDIHE